MLAVLCVEHHFQILYACAHVVSFQEQRPVIGMGVRLVHIQNIYQVNLKAEMISFYALSVVT